MNSLTPLKDQKTTQILNKCISLLQTISPSCYQIKQIHAFSLRHAVPLSHPTLSKHLIFALVSTLSSPMTYIHKIFSQTQNPSIFTWNTIIRGYAESQTPITSLEVYNEMRAKNVEPDTHTFPFLLKAVAKALDVGFGERVHSVLVKNGFSELVFVMNALVHMYAACGRSECAHKVFEEMPERNLVTWNSVMNGFALNGRPNEALTLFREMGFGKDGILADGFSMVTLLTACAELGALALGRRAHVYIMKVGLDGNSHVCNALLDLYAKCGSICEARRVFSEMREMSVVSWNALVVGLAMNGFGEEAIGLFKELEEEGLVPTEISFIGVLYACSHCGLVEEGFAYFERMKREFGYVPRIEHHGCLVDLLGRAGLVDRAYEYIKEMPIKPNAVIWRTLLGACTIHGHLGLGEYVRTKLFQLEPKHSGDYVLLSNLFASERRWGDVHNVRIEMLKEGVKKTPGYSLVELGNHVYEFMMGDTSHPDNDAIYIMLAKITKLLKLEGYTPHTSNVLADIEEEEKETQLSYHSEKIAIAFMLIKTPPNTPIRIVKNLRVCADCHLAIKLISKVFNREIVVRDRSRFHHFKDGSCTCKDYW